ncbi:MAG: hypothetical protein ABSH47_19105 [Bryobacteraceae bacterium]|jgi:hypothetical protein
MTSKEPALRIGQAAAQLEITAHHLRELCKSGLVEAEQSPGGQWRIPLTSIQRLQSEGVPPIPTYIEDGDDIEDGDEPDSPVQAKANNRLLAPPSPELIGAVEDAEIEEAAVRKEEAVVRKKENTVRRLRLEFEEQQARDRLAARAQEERQRAAAEQAAARQREDIALHRAWVEQWAECALRQIPRDVPGPLRLELHSAIVSRLAALPRTQSNTLTQRLVDAEVDGVLAPWTHQRGIDTAVEAVCSRLPFDIQYGPHNTAWKIRVMQAARKEIEKLGNVPGWQMEAAGSGAAKPIIAEFEQEQLCAKLAGTLPAGLTREEQEEARERVQEALARLPVHTSARRLEQARDTELLPFHQVLQKREHDRRCENVLRLAVYKLPYGISTADSKKALAEMQATVTRLPVGTPEREMEGARDRIADRIRKKQERQRRIEALIEDGLREIHPYVQRLVDSGRVELERGETAYSVAESFRNPVRQSLREELEGTEGGEDLKRLVQRIVREELDM